MNETKKEHKGESVVALLFWGLLAVVLTLAGILLIWVTPNQRTAVTVTVKNIVPTPVTSHGTDTGVNKIDAVLNIKVNGTRFELEEYPNRVFFIPDEISAGQRIKIFLHPGEKVEDLEATILGPMQYQIIPQK